MGKFNILIGAGSGQTQIAVYKDGVLVTNGFNEINFTGGNINVTTEGSRINVQSPPSTVMSHFNTSDGASNGVVANIATTQRIISTTLGNFPIGNWIENTQHSSINSTNLIYSIPVFSIINDSTTSLNIQIYGSDNISILESYLLPLTSNGNFTSGNINVQINDFGVDQLPKYKCSAIITINISNILSNGGRFSIKLTHNDDTDGNFIKSQNDIFYDDNIILPSITNPTFSVNTEVLGYSSGIPFYTTGTKLSVNIMDIDNINYKTYTNTLIEINGDSLGVPQLNIVGSDLTDWNSNYNNTNSYYSNLNWSISQPNVFSKGDLNIKARYLDWIDGVWQYSGNTKAIVSTFTNDATRKYEDFSNEIRRLMSDGTTLWDSTQDLSTFDSGAGLQVLGGKLIYPSEDFTLFNPLTGQKDYSASSGDKFYYSDMYHTNNSHSNGYFTFGNTNIVETDITSNDFELEVSLDKINWFKATSEFFGGILLNGDGCRIDSSLYNMDNVNKEIRFTYSTIFTTSGTGNGWGTIYRIKFAGTTRGKQLYIGSIELTDW